MGFFAEARAFLGNARDLLRASPATTPIPLVLQSMPTHGKLTPVRLSSAIALADTGYPYDLCDLANGFRQKDGHLQSVLGSREGAVAKLGWQVQPTDESKEAAAIAAFVEEVLKSLGASARAGADQVEVKNFRTLIAHLTSAVFYGYAVAEMIWEKKNFPLDPGNPKSRVAPRLVPVGSVHIAHRRFVFNQTTGRIHWFDVNAYVPGQPVLGVDLSTQTQGKFVVAQPRINGDIPAREGLSRVLCWLALFRNFSLRDLLELAQLAWKPWRIGTYLKNASKEDKQALVDAIKVLTSQGVTVLPETTKLQVEFPRAIGGSKGSQHQQLLDWLGREMSKASLHQTMTTDAGSSRAQAVVHDTVRDEVREWDAAWIAAVIQQQIITPLIRLNYGADTPVPLFSFVFEKTEDILAISGAVVNLVKSGVVLSQREIRKRTGFTDPKPGEEVVGGVAAVDPKHTPNVPPPPPPTAPDLPPEPEDEDDEDDPPASGKKPNQGDAAPDAPDVPMSPKKAA